jgi:hypothetical protein
MKDPIERVFKIFIPYLVYISGFMLLSRDIPITIRMNTLNSGFYSSVIILAGKSQL